MLFDANSVQPVFKKIKKKKNGTVKIPFHKEQNTNTARQLSGACKRIFNVNGSYPSRQFLRQTAKTLIVPAF